MPNIWCCFFLLTFFLFILYVKVKQIVYYEQETKSDSRQTFCCKRNEDFTLAFGRHDWRIYVEQARQRSQRITHLLCLELLDYSIHQYFDPSPWPHVWHDPFDDLIEKMANLKKVVQMMSLKETKARTKKVAKKNKENEGARKKALCVALI